jgi:hypothetical protein
MKINLMRSHEADYLWSEDCAAPFCEVHRNLARLNDYCLVALHAFHHEEHSAKAYFDDLAAALADHSRELAAEDKQWLGPAEIELGRETDQHPWSEAATCLGPSMCVALVCFFLEFNLLETCRIVGGGGKVKIPPGQSKVASCIRFLKEDCGLAIQLSCEVSASLDTYRKIRNAFAHGEWEECRDEISRIDLQDVFHTVSRIFLDIESAHEDRQRAGGTS